MAAKSVEESLKAMVSLQKEKQRILSKIALLKKKPEEDGEAKIAELFEKKEFVEQEISELMNLLKLYEGQPKVDTVAELRAGVQAGMRSFRYGKPTRSQKRKLKTVLKSEFAVLGVEVKNIDLNWMQLRDMKAEEGTSKGKGKGKVRKGKLQVKGIGHGFGKGKGKKN